MLVYGDHSETVDPRAYAEALIRASRQIASAPAGIARHAAEVSLLIQAGKLAQGVADAALDATGEDDDADRLPISAACVFMGSIGVSWLGKEDVPRPSPELLRDLFADPPAESVTLREPEGYAFYAVYPELYLEAPCRFSEPEQPAPQIVAIRSIGTSLGAAAACGAITSAPITVRPFGNPFARKIALSRRAGERLLRRASGGVLVVDEGPGVSGSSFGAVGDWLEDAGVPPERITYMPSHAGDLGPQASERHRARWRTAKKAYASFEDVILPRLPGWVEPLIGPLTEPLQDLSGGLWREALGVDAPAWPEQERRKYLAVTEQGRFLLKFAGLGGVGERKLERAKVLHASGFAPEPLGLAHGLLVEALLPLPSFPAHAGTQASRALRASPEPSQGAGEKRVWAPAFAGELGEKDREQLGGYLGFRARELQPPHGAASDDLLRTMMRRNLSLAGLPQLAGLADRLPAGERGPPCAIDGRLHAWEWRRSPDGRLIKLDALDHCEAHDLVGSQDVAWDLAGAAVELNLAPEAAERLRRITAAEVGQAIDPRRVAFQTLAYLAFQIGWWTFAAQGCEGVRAQAEVDRYKGLAARWSPLA